MSVVILADVSYSKLPALSYPQKFKFAPDTGWPDESVTMPETVTIGIEIFCSWLPVTTKFSCLYWKLELCQLSEYSSCCWVQPSILISYTPGSRLKS